MDSINLTLKRILHILTLLQDVCEKKRNLIETQDSKDFQSYLKEWKLKQKKVMKIHVKEKEQINHLGANENKCLSDDMEEIALVDSLIEKARNIRLNRKESTETFNNLGFKSFHESTSIKLNSNHLGSQQKKEQVVETIFNSRKVLPRSKSALPSSRTKAIVVPRSKSANVTVLPKEEKAQNFSRLSTETNSRKSVIFDTPNQANFKKSGTLNSVVISEKDLKEFKKSCAYSVCDKDSKNAAKGLNSDCIQDSSLNFFPTYLNFHSNCKRLSNTKNFPHLHKGGFWYPFLSAKHRHFLLGQRSFSTVESLTKAFELLHKIQEVLVWIDLLALTGKGTLPSLPILDKSDGNAVRISQYLRSLYHETFFKTPLLDSNHVNY